MWRIERLVGGGDWFYLLDPKNRIVDAFDPCNKEHMQKLALIWALLEG